MKKRKKKDKSYRIGNTYYSDFEYYLKREFSHLDNIDVDIPKGLKELILWYKGKKK